MDTKNPENEPVDASGAPTTPPGELGGISEQGDPGLESVLETVPGATENILVKPPEWGEGAAKKDWAEISKNLGPRTGGTKSTDIYPPKWGTASNRKPLPLEDIFAEGLDGGSEGDVGFFDSTPGAHTSSQEPFIKNSTEHCPPFRPLLQPQPTIPAPKRGLFSAFKDTAKKAGSFFQKHWKGLVAAPTVAAATVAIVLNSNSKHNHPTDSRVVSLPQTSHVQVQKTTIKKTSEDIPPAEDISQLTMGTPLIQDVTFFEEEGENMQLGNITPPKYLEPLIVDAIEPSTEEPRQVTENTPIPSSSQIITTPRELTPFEKELQKVHEIPDISHSLVELVIGKTFGEDKKTEENQDIDPKQEKSKTLPVTETPVAHTPSTIPLFVFSNGKKTAYILDRNQDGKITVDEERRGYFDAVGGNRRKNTAKMYKMADQLGLNSDNIRPENFSSSVTYSDITSGTPLTKTLTVGGLTYTISANTDLALQLGEKKLLESEKVLAENTKEEPVHTAETEIPKAIIVTEPDDEIPKALPIFEEPEKNSSTEEAGVLPPKNVSILPMFSPSENTITQRALSYKSVRELVLGTGKYVGNSQLVLPDNTESARATIEGWLGIIDAIREVSTDPGQQKMTLPEFYARHVTTIDKNQEHISMKLATFLRKYADYTDLQIAQAMGNTTIPKNFVDNSPRDDKLPQLVGTWDANGWEEAKNIVIKGAKRLYGDFPTTEQYNEYVRNNVSIENHPEIRTWFEFCLLAEREIRE